MKYIAHRDDEKEQPLITHLENTANICSGYAVPILKDAAWWCGYYHDIGKYSDEFQKRIRGLNIRVSHADCGAYEIYQNKQIWKVLKYILIYCIAGHHTGLQDGGTSIDDETMATLHSMLNSPHCDYSRYSDEVKAINIDFMHLKKYITEYSIINGKPNFEELIELTSFFIKYLFSCLTDADYIDTEMFFDGNVKRGNSADFEKALFLLNQHMSEFKNDTPIRIARKKLQEQTYKNFDCNSNIHVLNMPTGSGKTLCSIKIALDAAVKLRKKRIIYVIPYTAVIEQTAKEFRDIFGDCIPILEHHSNYDYEDESNESEKDKLKKSSENWDYPMVITTNIQFFQSVYSCKSSKLRKLHNMGDSIIVFDEIHILPLEYLKPCFRAIGYISEHLNSQSILLSATMPDYSDLFNEYLSKNKINYLITDKALFKTFEKCRYSKLGICDYDEIIEKSNKYHNALIILNSRKNAGELYERLDGNKYHLSTYMTPRHRKAVIDSIKYDLKNNKNITVVSTSLIEVGVDLDFQAVFRELSGLDNIIQAAGRCNREGKTDKGDVYVFKLCGEGKFYDGINANISDKLFDEYENIAESSCIEDYYRRLIDTLFREIETNTIAKGVRDIGSIPFRSYAEKFNLIKNESYGVVIPNEQNRELIGELSCGRLSVKRKLQSDMASVKNYELKKLTEQGVIAEFNGAAVLQNPDYYDENLGLLMENKKIYIC